MVFHSYLQCSNYEKFIPTSYPGIYNGCFFSKTGEVNNKVLCPMDGPFLRQEDHYPG